jgi:hypothetical protein
VSAAAGVYNRTVLGLKRFGGGHARFHGGGKCCDDGGAVRLGGHTVERSHAERGGGDRRGRSVVWCSTQRNVVLSLNSIGGEWR